MQRLRESHAGIMNIYDLGKCPSALLVFVALYLLRKENLSGQGCVYGIGDDEGLLG